jgi:hypothetical protein
VVKKRIVGAVGCSLVCAVSVVTSACFDAVDDCSFTLACKPPGGTGGLTSSSSSTSTSSTSSSSSSGAPANCDPTKSATAVADSCGVFVSVTGDDTAAGTKEKPLKTLMAAVATGKPIYACAGATPFREALVIASAVTVYGGLDCASWAYSASTKTALTAPADAVPLSVSNGTGATAVYDFAITAADATAPGGSSIAVLDSGAALTLTRCNLTAGKGADGSAGLTATGTGLPGANAPTPAPATALDGCVAGQNGVLGGQPGDTTCGSIVTSGGSGGVGQNQTTGGVGNAAPPQPEPNAMPAADGKGGQAQSTTPCTPGDLGANGVTSAPPGAGASGLGTIVAAGYQAPAATAGQAGGPGYGGGGGGGAKQCANGAAGPAGGGGGAGGCGGQGGGPGQSAGGSFGLLSVAAMVSLNSVTITTTNGGAGGAGGNGQPGGQGGNGGVPGSSNGDGSVKACSGGAGGQGGAGGPGGGGLGGPSAGIAFTGTAPVQTQVTIVHGSGGAGGPGGGMDMAAGVVGAAGVACTTLDFTTPSNPGACTP